jgi:leucyl/phenylalanyl-tRNA--protein transferase
VARLNAGGFSLLDAQFMNPHLETLGAVPVRKPDYLALLKQATNDMADFARFDGDDDPVRVLDWATPR